MPGVGVGGLISNFLNPGLNDQVARVMTPNAAPLAQQAAPDGQAGANMTPSVAPAPDPVNSQYIGTLLKASQQAAYAADLNRDFAGIAAGFGTAQQQHDKQAALGAGGGGADYLGQLKTMQGMQENTIADNEHARFMGNMRRVRPNPVAGVRAARVRRGGDRDIEQSRPDEAVWRRRSGER